MNRLFTLLLLLLLAFAAAGTAYAQAVRPNRTVYLRPQGGVASYIGDNNKSFFKFDGAFPYTTGGELGYQLSRSFGLGGGYLFGRYPGISTLGTDDIRHTIQLFGRYTFGGATGVAPYLTGGAHATLGDVLPTGLLVEERRTAYGPMLGFGIDIPLSGTVSLFLEATTHATFPDDAVDGRDDNGFGSFDLLTSTGTGLRVNFTPGVLPVELRGIGGPARLEVGQPGTFTAELASERAPGNPGFRWEWGDGAQSTGMTATHTYATAGSYTVRLTATNRGGTSTVTRTVEVREPARPAQIVTMRADPANPDTRTPVAFRADVRGDAPLTYRWQFGDGSTSSEAAPRYTYRAPGSYTVQLEVSNATGSDTRTLTMNVQPYVAEICNDVVEMNPVYFQRNESILSEEARRALRDNASILSECPNLSVRIEGLAAPGERNAQPLSEARAEAVASFYQREGIAASRMITTGLGLARGVAGKKDGTRQYQRVDTIPVR